MRIEGNKCKIVRNKAFTYVAGYQVAEFTVFAFKFGQIHCADLDVKERKNTKRWASK